MKDRTFSEAEIQSLLKRATQLHLQDEGEQPGLTLSDLEHIAAEAGVPPQYLRAALNEADGKVTPRAVSGHTKTHVYIDRVVPGDLTDEEWEQVVLRLRKEYSNDMADMYGMGPQYGRGVTEQLGQTREWRHTTGMGVVTTLTIRSANGKQFINLQRRVGLSTPRVEGLSYGALLAFLIAGPVGAVFQSPLIFILALVAAFCLAAPGIEYLDRSWRQKKLDDMESVVDDIAQLVGQSERQAAAQAEREALERDAQAYRALAKAGEASPESPVLSIPEPDSTVQDEPAAERNRTRA